MLHWRRGSQVRYGWRFADEPGVSHSLSMCASKIAACRAVVRPDRMRVITIDLLVDGHSHAGPLPEPHSKYDWRHFGTITVDRETGALVWRVGSYGFGSGMRVRELGQGNRIKVNSILLREPPGYSKAPRFTPVGLSVWPKGRY